MAKLLEARERRTRPGRDRKIITAWNALAIEALAECGRVFGRDDLIEAAEGCAAFILSSIRDREGRLMRYYLDGVSGVRAHLEDYAILAGALISLGEVAGGKRRLEEARTLTEEMIRLFYDEKEKTFYDIGTDDEILFARPRDTIDNDLPSGNSAAASLLFRASGVFKKPEYGAMAKGIVSSVAGAMGDPLSHGHLLCVHESMLAHRKSG